MAVRSATIIQPKSRYIHSLQPLASKKRKIRQLTRKKIRVTPFHTLVVFILFCGFFFGLQRLYLFLITWDNLNISAIEIKCSHEKLTQQVAQVFTSYPLGNILICDLDLWQQRVRAFPWAKKVTIRKSLPTTLLIQVEARQPAAKLMKNNQCWLIDRQGIYLEKTTPQEHPALPLIIDPSRSNSSPLLQVVWQFLDELRQTPFSPSDLAWIKITSPSGITICWEEDKTPILLGNSQFKQKLTFYHQTQAVLDQYRPLEYVDLRLEGRVYFRPSNPSPASPATSAAEEENHG
ncbi:MAG: hypothetical protein B5M54_00600 [Candidatus Aminicenantes bacterium 4484_214]|nr:MAG: hypothetical protein B5M54_00600 [Candidatus Aminicenantes bacterium 4484_214]RLE08990.1 MAG: hypothetical protein DRJ06_03730 [Candidatus Aminicenantes bacterium]